MPLAAPSEGAGECGAAAAGDGVSVLTLGRNSGLSAGAVEAGKSSGADPGDAASSSESVGSSIGLTGMRTRMVWIRAGPQVCTGVGSVHRQHTAR